MTQLAMDRVGTTQLYDKTVVYNHKRHGNFSLGGRKFDFRVKPSLPRTLSREFLLVDLVNNLDRLAESKKEVLARVKERRSRLDYGRSTTFTVSLKGITETEAAGIHEVCTIIRLSRSRLRYHAFLGAS